GERLGDELLELFAVQRLRTSRFPGFAIVAALMAPAAFALARPSLARSAVSGGWVFRGGAATPAGDDGLVEVTRVADHAGVAERLGTADAPPMKNQRVRCPRPSFLRQRVAQLLLDDDGV